MNNLFAIQTYLNSAIDEALVVDIVQEGRPAPQRGAHLAVVEAKPRGQNNSQLWEAIPDPAGSGYFFIQSSQADSEGGPLVIGIHGVDHVKDMTDRAPLGAFTPKLGEWHESQLWRLAMSSATQPNQSSPTVKQANYVFIESYLRNADTTPYVIDVRGWRDGSLLKVGNRLDAFEQKPTGCANQLWRFVPVGTQSPKITSFRWDPLEPTGIGVAGVGFFPGQTLALVCAFCNQPEAGVTTLGPPNLALTDFAGNLDMAAPVQAIDEYYGWGLNLNPSSPQLFSIAVFDNELGTHNPTPLCTAQAVWTGKDITRFQG